MDDAGRVWNAAQQALREAIANTGAEGIELGPAVTPLHQRM